MIRVDGDVSSEAFLHLLILEPQHMTEIASPVQTMIRGYQHRVMILVPVDSRAY